MKITLLEWITEPVYHLRYVYNKMYRKYEEWRDRDAMNQIALAAFRAVEEDGLIQRMMELAGINKEEHFDLEINMKNQLVLIHQNEREVFFPVKFVKEYFEVK